MFSVISPTAASFKGSKGKVTFGKGKGKGNKGKGKNNYYQKTSFNYASENDYGAAWGNERSDQWPNDNDDYSYGPDGNCNYSLHGSNYNYSGNYGMLLMKPRFGKCKLSVLKCFPRGVLLDDDSDSGSSDG